jgi:hypothetical protein
MQRHAVINWLHGTVTALLLIVVIVICGAIYLSSPGRNDGYSIASTKKISDNVYLYITRYDAGNATVSDIYRYYINKYSQSKDVLALIEKQKPFLVADHEGALFSASGEEILVEFTGKVFDFTNSVFFEDGGKPHFVSIKFVAKPDPISP